MRSFIGVLIGAAALTAVPLSAQEFKGEFGGWEVYGGEDNCGATMEFEGPGDTSFTVLSYADGTVAAAVTNTEWSAKKGSDYNVEFVLNERSYKGVAIGTSEYPRAGFLAALNGNFLRDFAAGSTLWILLDDKEIDRLSLAGTSSAMSAVDRCLAAVKRNIAASEREKARWAHLPKDPFAKPPPPPAEPNVATPRGNAGLWVNANDYPSQALREEHEGKTGFRVIVDETGTPTDCTILASSGSTVLDTQACTLIMRRARFNPAKDAEGRPTVGHFDSTVNWQIPR